jgi:hypothetical protein
LSGRIEKAKDARQFKLGGLSRRYEKDREALIARQDAEKAKMKEACRGAPQPEQEKRTRRSRKRDEPALGKEIKAPGRERQRASRDRQRDRSR